MGRPVGDHTFRVAATEASDGDLHPTHTPPAELAERERRLTGTTWAMVDQVHGVDVWYLPDDLDAGDPILGPRADILVGDVAHRGAMAVWSADCATALVLSGDGRTIGVHAGWRGLAAGALDRALTIAAADHGVQAVVLGPMIGPCCYEFGPRDLAAVADGISCEVADVQGRTRAGMPALDVPRAVDLVVERRGVRVDARAPGCTGCSGRWWSHRVRGDRARQALVGWWTV